MCLSTIRSEDDAYSLTNVPTQCNATDDFSAYEKFFNFIRKAQDLPAKDKHRHFLDRHALSAAPFFTSQVHALAVASIDKRSSEAQATYPQYGLLGSIIDENSKLRNIENLVFSNTSEPWSAFICGSQGSGKSYTLSCLLENLLQKTSPVNIQRSLSTSIVFHYDQFSSVHSGQLCESAYLCSVGVPVTVLVCPTSLSVMKERYENMPDIPKNCPTPRVLPLYLKEEQLSMDIIMSLMAVDDTGERMPLYITCIRQLLRQMILDKPDDPVFDYKDFLKRLRELPLTKDQLAPLNLRLNLLQSVLLDNKKQPHLQAEYDEIWQPKPGSLIIVDLSDPFVTESDACALFNITLKLYMGSRQSTPKTIALDEAHKFLGSSTEARKLTTDLVSVVRQQRHLGARVIIATQEPTVSGELLALCNASIIHRFTSPQWYSTLQQHLVAAYKDSDDHCLLRRIAGLNIGEAMVFCPTAILSVDPQTCKPNLQHDTYFKLAVRSRLSVDGGGSVLPSGSSALVICDDDNETRKEYDEVPQADGFEHLSRTTIRSRRATAEHHFMSSVGSNVSSEASHTGTCIQLDTTCTRHSLVSTSASVDQVYSTSVSDDLLNNDNHEAMHAMATTETVAIVYKKRRWTESELENLIYDQIRLLLGPKPVKDPWSTVVRPAFRALEKKCAVPERFFNNNELRKECKERRPIDMMRRLLRKYYDDLQVPREQRAPKKWLRD